MASAQKYSLLKSQRISLRNVIPLAKPFTVLFEPASICNFKCTCCFHSEPDIRSYIPAGRMKFEDFKKIADDLAAWKGDRLKVVRIIGFGEPLLNPATPRMVDYLNQLDIAERIEITTNASLLSPARSQQLIDAGLDYIRCSIYSVDPKRHAALTQNKISIDKIRNNIAELKKLRDSAGACKPFIYVKMLESSDESENAVFIEKYASVADEAALEKPHRWLSNAGVSSAHMRSVCPQPFKMFSVHFNGDVILCDPDWKGNTRVGNALEQNITTIWGDAKMRDFWRMQLDNRRLENESCRNCSFLVDEYAIDNLDGVCADVLGDR